MRALLTILLLSLAALAACSSGDESDVAELPPWEGATTTPSDGDDSGEDAGERSPGDGPDAEEVGASETDGDGLEAGGETDGGTLLARIDSGGLPFELSASAEDGQVCATFVAGEGQDESCEWPADPEDGLAADLLTVDGMQAVLAVVGEDVDAVEVVGATDGRVALELLDVGDGARVAGGPPPDAHAVAVLALDAGGDEIARVDL